MAESQRGWHHQPPGLYVHHAQRIDDAPSPASLGSQHPGMASCPGSHRPDPAIAGSRGRCDSHYPGHCKRSTAGAANHCHPVTEPLFDSRSPASSGAHAPTRGHGCARQHWPPTNWSSRQHPYGTASGGSAYFSATGPAFNLAACALNDIRHPASSPGLPCTGSTAIIHDTKLLVKFGYHLAQKTIVVLFFINFWLTKTNRCVSFLYIRSEQIKRNSIDSQDRPTDKGVTRPATMRIRFTLIKKMNFAPSQRARESSLPRAFHFITMAPV